LGADLYFSLIHRLTHKYLYKGWHEKHHKHVNELTGLLLYEGHMIDDYLMALSKFTGMIFYGFLCYNFMPCFFVTNISEFLAIIN